MTRPDFDAINTNEAHLNPVDAAVDLQELIAYARELEDLIGDLNHSMNHSRQRIQELEAALKPFADHESGNQAGDDYFLQIDDWEHAVKVMRGES